MTTPLRLGLMLTAVALAGCGGQSAIPPAFIDDVQARLGGTIDISLEKLLTEDRATLAKQIDDLNDIAKAHRTGQLTKPTLLLPGYRTAGPQTVLTRPKFSAKLGFSTPFYYKEGQPDAELALHLARHGDHEAARKIAPAGDAEIAKQIEAIKTEKNYPVEWTQLVALLQHLAELKVVDHDIHGATELARIHGQLNEILDARARSGPLGALLLPIGRRVLGEAAAEWRKPGHIKTVLATDIDETIKNWGEIPQPQPILVPGAPKEAVASIFGGVTGENGVAVLKEESLARTLDLLALPIVRTGVDGAIAFFDDKGLLAELQLVYVGKIYARFPDPRQLALGLTDRGIEGKEPAVKDAFPRVGFSTGGLNYDITLIPKSNSLGGIVRIGDSRAPLATAALPADPFDFLPLKLNRTFEANRLALDRQKSTEGRGRISIERSDLIQSIQQPVRDPLPAEVLLEREKDHDLVRALHFRWKVRQNVNHDAGARIAVPLWVAYGPATLEQNEIDGSGALILRWQQKDAAYTLRLPYNDTESLNLAITETDHTNEAMTKREKAAFALDRKDRGERMAQNKTIERLERTFVMPGLRLGMSRDEAAKILPTANGWQQVKSGDAVVLFNLTPPPPNVTSLLRELIVRYNDQNKITSMRAFYTEGPSQADARNPSLFDSIRQSNGEPTKVASAWAKLWSDLPAVGSPPATYRWHDDVTELRFQRDSFTIEVTLQDRPANAPDGIALTPVNLIAPGPEGCVLGQSKAEIFKKWPNPPAMTDGAVVLNQPSTSKYDALIVSFSDDRVSRIVARLREKPSTAPGSLEGVLQKFYAENPGLGLVRRRMTDPSGALMGGWGWHDDTVRIWAFGQDTPPEGPRAYVEWRTWPIQPSITAGR